jgi:3-deoxy-manno-octulosonate cytidylyltransferase (CMP-KDO synthetase)
VPPADTHGTLPPRSSAARPCVVVVIPARYGASRLPGKVLADLAGRPLIEHVYRRAGAAQSVERVIVATDDERVKAVVEGFGGTAVLTSAAHPSGTDRVAEAAAALSCDLVVNVQGDEPLIEPTTIDAAVAAALADEAAAMTTVCCALTDPAEAQDPHVVKVVLDRRGYALYFSRAPIPFVRPGGGASCYKHLGLYVYRPAFLREFARLAPGELEQAESLEQLRALEYGYRIRVVKTPYDSIGVDTPADLERARRALATRV